MRASSTFRYGAATCRALLSIGCATALGCGTDIGPSDELASGSGVTQADSSAPGSARTTSVALAEFEGYANPATGEFQIQRVTDLNPLAQVAALYEGRDLRTIGQASSLVGPSTLPRSTPAPWCVGVVENDGTPGSGREGTFELYTDPATIASSTIDGGGNIVVPSVCRQAGADETWYEYDGVFCADVRAMNFNTVPWREVHAQLYAFRGDNTLLPYAEGLGTSTMTSAGEDEILPQYRDLPDPGGELALWRYGYLAEGGGSATAKWTFQNGGSTAGFTFRGRIIGNVAENCATPDVNEDCDELGLGDNACRLYETNEPCTDDLDCVSYSCGVSGLCEDGCAQGLYGNACQFECPGGFDNVCSGEGSCDGGRDGFGVCTCNAGFHGDACQFSCSDGTQNGAEGGVDRGGPCPLPEIPLSAATVGAGWRFSCRQGVDAEVDCWGQNEFGQSVTGRIGANGQPFVQFTVGGWHGCGLRTDGAIDCWGYADDPGNPRAPALWTAASGVFTSVWAGRWHTCAVRDDGVAQCTGGYGTIPAVLTPVAPHSFVTVSGGLQFVCGLLTDGTVTCAGDNGHGQAPLSRSPTPGFTFIGLMTGNEHVCALRNDGAMECWGNNLYGQAPPLRSSMTGFPFVDLSVSTSSDHSCAIDANGTVQCWGLNGDGQAPPVRTSSSGLPYVEVAAGQLHTCAIRSDAVTECWGSNINGQAPPTYAP